MSAEGQRPAPFLQFLHVRLHGLIVFLVLRIQRGVTRQLGLIDPHGQVLDVSQLAQLDHLLSVDRRHLLFDDGFKVGACQRLLLVAQFVGALPFSPS